MARSSATFSARSTPLFARLAQGSRGSATREQERDLGLDTGSRSCRRAWSGTFPHDSKRAHPWSPCTRCQAADTSACMRKSAHNSRRMRSQGGRNVKRKILLAGAEHQSLGVAGAWAGRPGLDIVAGSFGSGESRRIGARPIDFHLGRMQSADCVAPALLIGT